jgi:hypothetical protein
LGEFWAVSVQCSFLKVLKVRLDLFETKLYISTKNRVWEPAYTVCISPIYAASARSSTVAPFGQYKEKKGDEMPVISMFFGIIIRMFYRDNKQHHLPHIHAEFQGGVAVFSISDGSILEGSLPSSKRKLVEAWIEIHREELLADWQLAVQGENVFRIKGLE